MGDVLYKSITAEDVTEAFTAVELRLKTAEQPVIGCWPYLKRPKMRKNQILQQIQRQ